MKTNALVSDVGSRLNYTVTSSTMASVHIRADECNRFFLVASRLLSPEEREELAFRSMPATTARHYYGKYVAIHNGAVAVSGDSDTGVAREFVRTFGDAPVYIGYVGRERAAYQVRPRQ